VITNCHTYFGRYNQKPTPIQMLQYFKENSITLSKAEKMKVNELENKFIIGEFINIEKETYNERYDKLIKELSAGEVSKK
ncbi:MAG: 2-oxoacid:ferredoxin oxidoreductase subunit beta, partial [Defluviitoga tunisiensis]